MPLPDHDEVPLPPPRRRRHRRLRTPLPLPSPPPPYDRPHRSASASTSAPPPDEALTPDLYGYQVPEPSREALPPDIYGQIGYQVPEPSPEHVTPDFYGQIGYQVPEPPRGAEAGWDLGSPFPADPTIDPRNSFYRPCDLPPTLLNLTNLSVSDDDDDEDASQPCCAAPLLQVLSVRINSKSKKLVSVYGYITVGERDGYEYELFDRDKGDPENIYRGGFSLSLSGPTIEAITPSKGAIMCTSLKFNEQQGKSKESFIKEDIILDSLLDLEKDEPYLYNTIQSVVLESKNVSATVYYTTILHGIDAVVDMSFLKNIASADLPENVYLLVCARFTKSQHFAISESDTHLHTIIFRRSLSKFVETHGGVLVKKHVVVVPVYSSLIIEFYVGKLGSESCYGTMEFCVDKGPYERQYIRIPSGDVQVKVDWAPASKRFFQDTSVWGSLIPKVKSQRRFSNSRLEVFSICICGIDRDVGAVYGTVKIWDGDETYCIFEKDKKNYESVKNGSLSIYGPARSIGSTSYCIYLKDPHHRVGIKGNIGWTESSLEFNGVSDLFDKRLCMVVQGKGAYAVVHHTVFRGAAQATVNVSVSFRESENISALVHGLVAASYGKFEYLSCYEEKYYKSKLFERSKSEGVWVSEGDDLPLLKSVVAVTQHSSLVVEFDLKVSCGSPGYWSPEDEFNQKVGFMVAESGQATQIIRARMYDIEVSVNWRR